MRVEGSEKGVGAQRAQRPAGRELGSGLKHGLVLAGTQCPWETVPERSGHRHLLSFRVQAASGRALLNPGLGSTLAWQR